MSFTVEDGTGLPGANALLSVAAFKAYCDLRGLSYSDFTDTVIEQAIVRASDYLSTAFNWQGFRKNERGATGGRQGLAWPRVGVVDRAGYSVDDDSIPDEIESATAELAFVEAGDAGVLAPSYTPHERVKSEKVDVLAVEYDTSRQDAQGARPVLLKVNELVGPFLEPGSTSRISGPTALG